jgi:NitT/TauT family transport system substrate-binding protein
MQRDHIRLSYAALVVTAEGVIPENPGSESGAGAGIQSLSGCPRFGVRGRLLKSGMTSYLKAGAGRRLVMITAILVTMVTLVGSFSCSRGDYSGKVETVTIGATPIELNALIYVADEQKFFVNNGVKVVFKDYDTGVAAVDGLLKGEVDIALTMEFVIVGKSLQKQEVLSLATIDKSMIFYVIARADRGIKAAADLKEKKIGAPRHTITEFYLGRMLELNGMRLQQVTMVDTKVSDPAGAIAGGDVDAVITWEPHVTQIRQQMENRVIIWSAQSGQVAYWSVVSTPRWINKHPDIIRKFLNSLAQAEVHIPLYPKEAKTIVQKWLKYDDAYMAAIWPEHEFSLSLDQSLIAAMEDEARWMIKNNLTREKQPLDFVNYLYVDGLKAIKPEAVNIIR